MRHIFIYDPAQYHEKQRKIDNVFDNIGQYFRSKAISDYITQIPRFPRDTIGIIQKQIEEKKEGDFLRVYAIGSEEILFDCVNGIAELDNADLAIMPQGFNNDFLQVFGSKYLDRFNDISAAAVSPSIPTDLIKVGNIYALNACVIGTAAVNTKRIIDTILKKKTKRFFPFRMFFTILKNFYSLFNRKITAKYFTISADGINYSGNYYHIGVFNGLYYNGKKTAAVSAVPDDGYIDVALLRTVSSIAAFFSMKKFTAGKIPNNCVLFRAKKITIQSETPFLIQIDNEFIRDTNVTMEAVPKAVKIVSSILNYPVAGSSRKQESNYER